MQNRKKIAVVAGHYMEEIGYIEVFLSTALSELGHVVKVFTSTSPSPSSAKIVKNEYQAGTTKSFNGKYDVCRLPTRFKYRSSVMSKGLPEALSQFSPDVIFILAVGKLFALPILNNESLDNMTVISTFADHRLNRPRKGILNQLRSLTGDFFFSLFKRPIYRKCISLSDRVVTLTPDTERVLRNCFSKRELSKIQNKFLKMSLGFDSNQSFFDVKARRDSRKELAVSERNFLLFSVTKIQPNKGLEEILQTVFDLHQSGIQIRFVLAGFQNDKYSNWLREFIQKHDKDSIVQTYNFVDKEKMRALSSASDAGVWISPTIAILESMGTGLSVILPNNSGVCHLVHNEKNGHLFEKGELKEKLLQAYNEFLNAEQVQIEEQHAKLAEYNKKYYSYRGIASRILESLEKTSERDLKSKAV